MLDAGETCGIIAIVIMNNTAIAYTRTAPGYALDILQQEAVIRDHAAKTGIDIERVYRDRGRYRLRGRDALLHAIANGAQAVVVVSPCRLSPDLLGLVRVLGAIHAAGARVIIASDNDDMFTTAMNALVAGLPTLLAAREGMRLEAVAAGRERARARGVRLGRPPVDPAKIIRAQQALATGIGIRPTARLIGASPATIIRVRDAMAKPP